MNDMKMKNKPVILFSKIYFLLFEWISNNEKEQPIKNVNNDTFELKHILYYNNKRFIMSPSIHLSLSNNILI